MEDSEPRFSYMHKMFPQSELENYKLQVELLQEKLQRSEENRNQLENKLQQILQKRNEHDKSVRAKARQKYQQFLEEQKKRNERNKLLMQMLERIDEQTSAMSARSERLKMMKMQYEMYFAKLVQAQTMRCIQNSATATATIPVLMHASETATAAATAPSTATPLKEAGQTMPTFITAPAATSYQIDRNLLPTAYNGGNFYQLGSINTNENLPTARQWTLALATPAPTNMYTMTATQTAAAVATARMPTLKDLDYLKYPIGYLPASMQFAYQQQQQQQQQQQPPDAADVLSTNRYRNKSFDNDSRYDATLDEIADIDDSITSKQKPQQSHMTTASKAHEKTSNSYDKNNNNNSNEPNDINSQYATAEICGPTDRFNNNNISRKAAAAEPTAQQSPFTTTITTNPPTDTPFPTATTTTPAVMTASTDDGTTLTFDKLSTDNGKSKTFWQSTGANDTVRNHITTPAAPTTMSGAAGVKLPKATEFLSHGKDAAAYLSPSDAIKSNSSNAQSVNNATTHNNFYKDAEKLAAVNPDAIDADDANIKRGHKIDEAWSTSTTTTAMSPPTTTTFDFGKDNDNIKQALAVGDKHFDSRNNRNLLDTELTPAPTTTAASSSSREPPYFPRKEKMSIENIENTVYGEMVKPNVTDLKLATVESTKQAPILAATNGLLKELTNADSVSGETPKDSIVPTEQITNEAELQQADYDYSSQPVTEPLTSYSTDNHSNYAESAHIEYDLSGEDGTGNMQANDQYANDAEAQQYQQYDATHATGQDYDPNLDYQNYDEAAYQAAYDPNAYPGYTYDETTGQYTANDDMQQYAEQTGGYNEAAYMQSDYNEAILQQEQQQEGVASNYDNYGEYQEQQPQQQDDLNAEVVAQSTADLYNTPAAAPETVALPTPTSAATTKIDQTATEPPLPSSSSKSSTPSTPAQETGTPAVKTSPLPSTPTPAPAAPIKPILSTEKSGAAAAAAANDAQQKRKKRVNFVDSSETDESSSVKPDGATGAAGSALDGTGAGSSESDFDFSSSGGATNN